MIYYEHYYEHFISTKKRDFWKPERHPQWKQPFTYMGSMFALLEFIWQMHFHQQLFVKCNYKFKEIWHFHHSFLEMRRYIGQ